MKERVSTGILIALLFLIVFYIGQQWFIYSMLLLALVGYYEFTTIIKIKKWGRKWFIGALGVILLFIPLFNHSYEDIHIKVILALIVSFLIATILSEEIATEQFSIEKAGTLLIGVLYIGFGFQLLVQARLEEGIIWTFTVLIIIWSTDTGAYFVGKTLGKTKLAPNTSPNKTVEGSVGGIVVALLVGLLMQWQWEVFSSYFISIIVIIFISMLGQLGDLAESALKRYFQVKDSGKIFPGHGGVLDRLDSWIFVFIGLKIIGII